MKSALASPLNGKSVFVRNAELSDQDALQALCATWTDKLLFEGSQFEPDYIHKSLTNPDLPPVPDASADHYHIKTIFSHSSAAPIGFMDLYEGYPDSKTLWIGMFMLAPEAQGFGYGQEALELLAQAAAASGYKTISLAVYLKNWIGLRFWHKNGFATIRGLYGDKTYSPDNFALIALDRAL